MAFPFTRVSREWCHCMAVQTTLPMIASTLLSSVPSLPAAAVVAFGVLGAIDVRRRLRTRARPALHGAGVRNSSVLEAHDETAGTLPMAAMDQVPSGTVDDADDPKDAALQLLERWSAYPQSTWRALGLRCLTASHREAGRVAASRLILEGVVAHHADPLDAWIVRDAAETAWMLTPRDRTSLPFAVEDAARRAVLHAALAVLARAWLPPQDFNRLLASAAH